MVENIMLIVALCMIAAVLCKLIGKYNKEQAVMLSVVTCALLLGFILIRLFPVLDIMQNLYSECGVSDEYITILFKSIGICYIARFAYDVCRDCGETAIATVVETAGRAAILILSIPLLEDISSCIRDLALI